MPLAHPTSRKNQAVRGAPLSVTAAAAAGAAPAARPSRRGSVWAGMQAIGVVLLAWPAGARVQAALQPQATLQGPNPQGGQGGMRHLATVRGIAPLPASSENAYDGEPLPSIGKDPPARLVDLAGAVPLCGPTDRLRFEHLFQPNPSNTLGDPVNAVLGGLLTMDEAQLQARLQPVPGDGGARHYNFLLCHREQPRIAKVDSRFFAVNFNVTRFSGGAKNLTELVDEASALDDGAEALWPLLVNKAFNKLMDSYPATYLPQPGAPSTHQSGNALRLFGLDPVQSMAALTCTTPVLLAAAALGEAALYVGLAAIPAEQTAILRFPDFAQRFAAQTDSDTGLMNLTLTGANRCLGQAGDFFDGLNCTVANGNRFHLMGTHYYTVLRADMFTHTVILRDPDNRPLDRAQQEDPYRRATSGRSFALPSSLVRDLNATFYVSRRAALLQEAQPDIAPAPAPTATSAASMGCAPSRIVGLATMAALIYYFDRC